MLLYALVWTLVALASMASVVVIAGQFGVSDPLVRPDAKLSIWGNWLGLFLLAADFLFVAPPAFLAWLLCIVAFSLVHLGWLWRLVKQEPFPGDVVLARSLQVGAAAGLVQAALVIALTYVLWLPLGLRDVTSQTVSTFRRSLTLALLAYGVSPWIGSLAAGWAVGGLWAWRTARIS